MNRPAFLLGAIALALSSFPSWAQDTAQSAACRNELDRFAATFAAPKRGDPGSATTPIPSPSTTQAEQDMARRGGVVTPSPLGSGTVAGTDAAPGARAGTNIDEEEQRQLHRRIDEARAAADRGDAEGCMRSLREARATMRQSGFGGSGGSAAPSGASGGGAGTGSLNTNTSGSRPPGAPGSLGSTPSSAGRGSPSPGTGGGGAGGTAGSGSSGGR